MQHSDLQNTLTQKRASSIRCTPARTTLARAKAWMKLAGISRVTDITQLDCLGLPIFAGIRPRSQSECVTYGKGLLPIDAQVGAYMEAIEFYFAEPNVGKVETQWGTAKELVGADIKDDAVLDFSPIFQKHIDLNGSLLLAVAENIESGSNCLIPAELVHFPAKNVGQSLFGSSTNGLASGNSVLEASIHGLTELIERDIWSFQILKDTSVKVNPETLPKFIKNIIERVENEDSELIIRYVANDYGLPFFASFVSDRSQTNTKYFSGGWGCHTDRSIALVRSVTEAAQNRLALIHGVREALQKSNDTAPTAQTEQQPVQNSSKGSSTQTALFSFSDIPTIRANKSLNQQWHILIQCLRKVTDKPICRVVYTPGEAPLHVIRIVVPTLEHFTQTTMRVGHRLKAAIDADD